MCILCEPDSFVKARIEYQQYTTLSYKEPLMKTICHFIRSRSEIFLVLFLLSNLISFALFHSDKKKAEKKAFRIPESNLLGFSALFGALGGILGMIICHHKTNKPKFLILMPLMAAVQLLVIFLVFTVG